MKCKKNLVKGKKKNLRRASYPNKLQNFKLDHNIV